MPRQRAKRETSAGGVVMRCTEHGPRFLVIRDGHRNWGFPKGHVDPGERPEEAARREIGEETGLDNLTLHDDLGEIDWYFRERGRLIHKFCRYFLFESAGGDPVPQTDEGITDCRWVATDEASGLLRFESARQLLERAASRVEARREWCGGGNGVG